MTRIDFYILKDVDMDARMRFACTLTARAVDGGHPVFIRAADEAAVAILDDFLWRYPANRFLPHVVGNQQGNDAAVCIHTTPPANCDGLMINLGDDVPDFYGRFERVAEIVVGANRDAGRQHYRRYRHRGNPLHHHELDDWEAGA
ncbi:MAG: DNA polymerase III subunit chi [Pseudomonadales bacterium]|nr:DNA polymerase III subunit chi [Pseudomonadales bacterium]